MKLSKHWKKKINEILSMKKFFLKFMSFYNDFIHNSNKLLLFLISRQSMIPDLGLLPGLEKLKERSSR